ncbi:OsmC family protein [Thalassobacillus sp. B23F22_16]|uniref:OsmC family protein n=1 Tax=Thalassobacillus sp. B23F22_16 TaxID=3459513 RepID=UPI00373FB338
MPNTTFYATVQLQEGMKVTAKSRNFEVTIDEPVQMGGTDTGMSPVELLLNALGACQAIVARAYARHFGIEFDGFRVEVAGDLDTDGFMHKSDVRCGFSDIRYTIHIDTEAPREKVAEFIAFIEKTCPVGDTLANKVKLKLEDFVITSKKQATPV